MKDRPKFVKMGDSALRLLSDGKTYQRDAGMWDVGSRIINGILVSWNPSKAMPWLHKVKLVEITEAEWRIDNRGYVDHLKFDLS